MGFNVTALAQKARTQTLIVDSDLDMGQYDVIATDVKGDTAEFSEFVGGVGNFTSGLFSGGVDVSGILHAESNTQVDGNIILEGSINNVNIADDGEITTTKGVNGADFNGAIITSDTFNGVTMDNEGHVYAFNVTPSKTLHITTSTKTLALYNKSFTSINNNATGVLSYYTSNAKTGTGNVTFNTNALFNFVVTNDNEEYVWFNNVDIMTGVTVELKTQYCNATIVCNDTTTNLTNDVALTITNNRLKEFITRPCVITIIPTSSSYGGSLYLIARNNSGSNVSVSVY